jgi:hypothetical protein
MLLLMIRLFEAAHEFTHNVLHPMLFGCCPTQHPNVLERHFQTVERIERNTRPDTSSASGEPKTQDASAH